MALRRNIEGELLRSERASVSYKSWRTKSSGARKPIRGEVIRSGRNNHRDGQTNTYLMLKGFCFYRAEI